MPARKGSSRSQTDPAVADFLRALDHPRKREIEAVREILLGVSPRIHEGIKWNAPSFRTTEYFATFHLRAKDAVQFVFHLGAKGKEIAAHRKAFEAIVRAWIEQMSDR